MVAPTHARPLATERITWPACRRTTGIRRTAVVDFISTASTWGFIPGGVRNRRTSQAATAVAAAQVAITSNRPASPHSCARESVRRVSGSPDRAETEGRPEVSGAPTTTTGARRQQTAVSVAAFGGKFRSAHGDCSQTGILVLTDSLLRFFVAGYQNARSNRSILFGDWPRSHAWYRRVEYS